MLYCQLFYVLEYIKIKDRTTGSNFSVVYFFVKIHVSNNEIYLFFVHISEFLVYDFGNHLEIPHYFC